MVQKEKEMVEAKEETKEEAPVGKVEDVAKPAVHLEGLGLLRGVSRRLVRGEVAVGQAAQETGLQEEVVEEWLASLEDLLASRQETVEQARRFQAMRGQVAALGKVLGELQEAVGGAMGGAMDQHLARTGEVVAAMMNI